MCIETVLGIQPASTPAARAPPPTHTHPHTHPPTHPGPCRHDGKVKLLTKGDNNAVDDRGLYAHNQLWVEPRDVVGRARAYVMAGCLV